MCGTVKEKLLGGDARSGWKVRVYKVLLRPPVEVKKLNIFSYSYQSLEMGVMRSSMLG